MYLSTVYFPGWIYFFFPEFGQANAGIYTFLSKNANRVQKGSLFKCFLASGVTGINSLCKKCARGCSNGLRAGDGAHAPSPFRSICYVCLELAEKLIFSLSRLFENSLYR